MISIYTYQILCTNNNLILFDNKINNSIYTIYYYISNTNYIKNVDNYYISNNNFIINNASYYYNIIALYDIYIQNIEIIIQGTTYKLLLELQQLLLYSNIYKVYFFTKISNNYLNSLNFECLQTIIYLYPNETTLIFFRLESNVNVNLMCLTIYIVYPLKISFMVTKLQCFCFSNIFIHAHELIELPVLFYIDKLNFIGYKVYIFYLLLIL